MSNTLLRDLCATHRRPTSAPTAFHPARAGHSVVVRIRTQAITLPIQTRTSSRISVSHLRLTLLSDVTSVVQTLRVTAETPLSVRSLGTATAVTTLPEISAGMAISPIALSEQVLTLKIQMRTQTVQRMRLVRCLGL